MIDNLFLFIQSFPPEWIFVIFFCGTFVEYFFPVFPGDTMALFGAFLTGVGAYSLPLMFAAITAGNFVGMISVYAIGHIVLQPRYHEMKRDRKVYLFIFSYKHFERLDKLFKKYGYLLISANRFIPFLRAPFFWYAGLLRLSIIPVIGLGSISLLCWNGLLFYAGYKVGDNWFLLKRVFTLYNQWVISAAVLAVISVMVYRYFSSSKKAEKPSQVL